METITYEYGGGLYVNLTNRCDCACVFCLRQNENRGSIYADDLWLDHEPSRQEALEDLLRRDLPSYEELVFCGFGEPTFRTDDILWLIDELKKTVPGLPPVRINTNGHGCLISGRDVVPELIGRVDRLSISLNGATEETYLARTRPRDGAGAWHAMLAFTRAAASAGIEVTMTAVDRGMDPEELSACEPLANSLGARFRVRHYIDS